MRIDWRWFVQPLFLCILLGGGGLWAKGCIDQQIGKFDAALQARDSAIAAKVRQTAKTDTIFIAKTDTLRLIRTKTDSILDTLRLTDTLIHRDTVIQLVERERLACDAVIRTCEERVAQRDSIISLQAVQLKAEHGRDRILGVKLPSRTASLILGAVACKLFCP